MLADYSPLAQAVMGTLFTWFLTALGAAVVFIVPSNMSPAAERKLLNLCLGFAGGVMLAASFWSLLDPALEHASEGWSQQWSWVPVAIGFLAGGLFVFVADKLLPDPDDLLHGFYSASSSSALQEATSVAAVDAGDKRARADGGDEKDEEGDDGDGIKSAKRGGAMRKRRAGGESEGNSSSKNVLAVSKVAVAPKKVSQQQQQMSVHESQTWRRILLLVIAVTVHNAPEGLSVGVGFGRLSAVTVDGAAAAGAAEAAAAHASATPAAAGVAAASSFSSVFAAARQLAIGIGLQNFPEGMAVSLPLLRLGVSKGKAFFIGQLSGAVEPLAALFGAWAVSVSEAVLPYAMAFAAGAMVFVVVDQLVPEAHRAPPPSPQEQEQQEHEEEEEDRNVRAKEGHKKPAIQQQQQDSSHILCSLGIMVGFVMMMALDVGLG